jgi:phosphatidylserine/phosphatidylglycerophosphate/cardiolipin synthase-like enzyme
MNLHELWKTAGTTSPLFRSLVDAATRGVRVRVLLNDESVFSNKPSKNLQSVTDLNAIALSQGTQGRPLPLEAAIADLASMKVSIIHNKGVLVDGEKVLVSSINWNENSVKNNRETAVVITSKEAYDAFEALFEQDWRARRRPSSAGKE